MAASQALGRLVIGARVGDGQIEIGVDDLQQVVEVVRHAAGKMAHGLHLLRLAHASLRTHALGHVGGGDQEAFAGDVGLVDVERAIAAQHAGVVLTAMLGGRRHGVQPVARESFIDRAEFRQRRAHRGQRGGKIHQAEEYLVERGDLVGVVEHHDAVADVVERRLQDARLPRPDRFAERQLDVVAHQHRARHEQHDERQHGEQRRGE